MGLDIVFADTALAAIDRLSVGWETATPEQIGIYAPTTASVAAGSTVSVRHRIPGGVWINDHPLLRIQVAGNEIDGPTTLVDAFAGTIFGLTQNTTYEVELTHVESGRTTKRTSTQRTTRALPATAGSVTDTASTAGQIATKFSSFTGNVLEIAAGTYTVSGLTLTASGTSGSPVYIRGASKTGTILSDTTGNVLRILASHVILENLTIQGSGVDTQDTTPLSFGMDIDGTNITIRDVIFQGVDCGILAGDELTGALIYNCNITGNNAWTSFNLQGTAPTGNDTGVEIPGFGNCLFQNTIVGFGDGCAFTGTFGDGFRSIGNYIYRNKFINNCDDTVEFDYGTRNLAFYDNMSMNCSTAMSMSYHYGGPAYYFRNVTVNTIRGPYKINGEGIGVTGFLIYNNTIVRTDGSTANYGMIQTGADGNWQNYSFRNNLLVYRGTATGTMAMEAGDNNPCDFDYNAWYPNDNFFWQTNYANLAAAQAGHLTDTVTPLFGSSQRQQHDVITISNPFTNAITLGSDHLTEITSTPDATLSSSGPKGLGVVIPGITDDYSGSFPDIGAIITGRTAVTYGAPSPASTTIATGLGSILLTGIAPSLAFTGSKSVSSGLGSLVFSGFSPTLNGGASSLPTWVSSLSTFTWQRLTSTAPTIAGSQSGDQTHLDGITAYSGAAYDPTRRQFMFNGGGHNDGAGNGVFAVRVGRDTPDVVALMADSTSAQTDVSYYADGKPSAAHTYGTLIYVPSMDGMMRFGNTASYGSGNSKFGTVDRFKLNTNTWDAAGTFATMPSGSQDYEMHTCRDDSDNVYVSSWGTSSIRKWTNGTPGSWSTFWSGGAGIQGGALVFDTNRQRIVYFGGTGQAAWWNLSGTRTGITFTGLGASENAWVYCPSRDTYIGAFTSGNTVTIRECDPTTFNVTSLSVAGTSGGVGASGFGSIHNRLQIDDTMKIVMVHANLGSTDLWAFKYA